MLFIQTIVINVNGKMLVFCNVKAYGACIYHCALKG